MAELGMALCGHLEYVETQPSVASDEVLYNVVSFRHAEAIKDWSI